MGRCLKPTPHNFVVVRANVDSQDAYYLQRLVGVAGDHVDLRDGSISVDGQRVERELGDGYRNSSIRVSVTLDPDQYFVVCNEWPGFLAASGTPVTSTMILGRVFVKLGNISY